MSPSCLKQLNSIESAPIEANASCCMSHIYTGCYSLIIMSILCSVNAAVGGVGLLIGPRALKTLNSVEKIQPRMMAAIFNGNPRATIISCYSPTNVSEENELVTFYDELSSLVRSIPKHNMLVIGGDMNAQIGKKRKQQIQPPQHVK